MWLRPVHSMSMGPELHFFCCEVESFDQKRCGMEYHDMDKAFSKSMDGSFAEALHAEKANRYPECLFR